MRKSMLAYLSAAVMIGTIFLVPGAATANPTPQDIGTEVIGGRTWTTDIRVTRNGGQDHVPQITVDADHDAHILWQSTRSPSGYYYVKLNRQGELLSEETFISSKILTSWGAQYVYGPTIDIDSQENLHVVFDFDYQNVGYAKFDYQGNELVAEKKVGPVDGGSSHTPSVAVGTDDTVHISNEDYKFQCEDDVYHKLANDGTEIWTNRVVSSDVATHVEFDLIKVSRYSGNILFTFGSSSGTWLGRMDKYGVKSMPSVKIRPETDYKIVDVTETPNGDMHCVWFDPTTGGKIHYSRVNATGVKQQDNIIIAPNAVNAGMPRIASTGSGLAVVVWEDRRNGNMDIYYAVIDNTLFTSPTDMVLPENVRLTQQGNDQTEPWVAIDPDDNFHVAWTDMRDGNQEIYYKFMFNFALELYADPIDLANLFFIHPNETKILTMYLKNKGGLKDSYTIDLSYSPGATQDGWRIDIDTTVVNDLAAGEVTTLQLTMHAPADAKKGDHVNMTINASSQTAPGSWDTIEINTYVQVTRSLSLNVAPNLQVADNGETVAFTLVAKNTGDVIENQINIRYGGAETPQGWTVASNKDTLALEPQESGAFTMSVTVPADTSLAPANMLGRIGILVESSADSTVTAARELLVSVKANFVIGMKADFERQFIDPGDSARYTISINNIGNLAGQAQINVESQQPSQAGWVASLDRETVFLRGGEQTDVVLTVTSPQNAIANSRLPLVVSAFALKFGTTGSTDVTTFVNRIYGLTVDVGAAADVRVGRVASYPVTVTNTGNGDETLTLAPYLQEAGWSMSFAQSAVEVQSIFVPHGETRTFEARATTDSHAAAGIHTPVMNIIDEAIVSHYVPLPVRVVQFFSVELTAQEFKLAGSPLKTLQYDLDLKNLGNGPDNFTLSIEPLDVNAWDARYFLVVTDQTAETLVPVTTVALTGGGTAHVRLLITVPRATDAQEVQFTAHATSASGESDALLLVAEVRLADLTIDRIDFSPTTPIAGEITAITLTISNAGDIEGTPVKVEFYDQGSRIATDELTRVAGGQKGYVTFAWLPTPGDHSLRFVVDPPAVDPVTGLVEPNGLVFEKNELDNEKTQVVSVGATTSFLPGFDGAFALAGIAMVALGVASRRRRD
jgi:uncharacterized membrane protein